MSTCRNLNIQNTDTYFLFLFYKRGCYTIMFNFQHYSVSVNLTIIIRASLLINLKLKKALFLIWQNLWPWENIFSYQTLSFLCTVCVKCAICYQLNLQFTAKSNKAPALFVWSKSFLFPGQKYWASHEVKEVGIFQYWFGATSSQGDDAMSNSKSSTSHSSSVAKSYALARS